MPETTFKITTDVKGAIVGLEQVGGKLKELNATANDTQNKGMKGFTSGLADMKAGVDLFAGAAGQVISVISDFNALGVASRQAKETLATLSGSGVDAFIGRLTEATGGWVDATQLAQQANLALGLKVAKTKDDVVSLARSGAILGQSFRHDAAQGVETLTTALSRVGQTMLLDNIGLSADRVMKKFAELKLTMSDQDAWSMAVLGEAALTADKLAGSLDGAGAGVAKLGTAFDQVKTGIGETVSDWADKLASVALSAGATYDTIVKIANINMETGYRPEDLSKSAIAARLELLGYKTEADKIRAELDAIRIQATPGDGTGNIPLSSFAPAGPAGPNNNAFTAMFMTNYQAAHDSQMREVAQMARDMAKRDAVRRYQGLAGFGSDLVGAGGNVSGASFIAAGQSYNKQFHALNYANDVAAFNRVLDVKKYNDTNAALKTMNQIFEGGKAILSPVAQGINNIATAYDNMSEAAKRGQSLSAAFGYGNGGLFGEIGGGMGGAINQRRDALQQELEKKYGKGNKKVESGLAAFDKESGKAMDAYAIATGQATKGSVELNHQLSDIYKRFGDGKIGAAEMAKEIRDLGVAAQNSGGDLDTLLRLTGRSADQGSTISANRTKNKPKWGIDPRPGAYTGQQAIDTDHTSFAKRGEKEDPFASLTTNLDGIDTKIKNITTNTQAIPKVMQTQMQDAADKVKPLEKAIDMVVTKLNSALIFRQGIDIRITSTGNYGGDMGNAGQGSGQGTRPF